MITPDDLEKILSSLALSEEERKKASILIADKVNEEKQVVDQLCFEVISFIEKSRNGCFKAGKLFLFEDYLAPKFPSLYKEIYVGNLDNLFNLLNVGLGNHVKIKKTESDICICFFSDETVMLLAKIFNNSIVQKLDYNPKNMELTISLIIMDKDLITWQDNDSFTLDREMELFGKIFEKEKLLYLSVNVPEHIFDNVYIPLVMKDDTVPISFILRDSLDAAVNRK